MSDTFTHQREFQQLKELFIGSRLLVINEESLTSALIGRCRLICSRVYLEPIYDIILDTGRELRIRVEKTPSGFSVFALCNNLLNGNLVRTLKFC